MKTLGDGISILIVGGTRGLGAELAKSALEMGARVQVVGRKAADPDWRFDLSQLDSVQSLIAKAQELKPSHIWWVAGGGPHGDFAQKEWKDHAWALQVGLLSPAISLHAWSRNPWPELRQLIFVGSAIAGGRPDPKAASYAAAKHGLQGLISSVQSEASVDFDLRLFSPGYFASDLLPKNAGPRGIPGLVQPVGVIAQRFLNWALDSSAASENLVL